MNKTTGSKNTQLVVVYLLAFLLIFVSWDKQGVETAKNLGRYVYYRFAYSVPELNRRQSIVPLQDIRFYDIERGMVGLHEISDVKLKMQRRQGASINDPVFAGTDDNYWLADHDMVIGYADETGAWAFPLTLMYRHNIVNARLGGRNILVSYSPLSGSGIVFDRQMDQQTLEFTNTSGLYQSNMVMVDFQTGNFWRQMDGKALIGNHCGERITILPSMMTTWASWRQIHPHTEVLLSESFTPATAHFTANYRRSINAGNFHPYGVPGQSRDDRLPSGQRVLSVQIGDSVRAYPLSDNNEQRVFMDQFAGKNLLVAIHGKGGNVFDVSIDARSIQFNYDTETITDVETGTLWDFSGLAVSGILQGSRLTLLPVRTSYWFALAGAADGISLSLI